MKELLIKTKGKMILISNIPWVWNRNVVLQNCSPQQSHIGSGVVKQHINSVILVPKFKLYWVCCLKLSKRLFQGTVGNMSEICHALLAENN